MVNTDKQIIRQGNCGILSEKNQNPKEKITAT
jgi:hypothetical protein